MADKIYKVRPLAHLLHLEDAPINAPYLAGQWGSVNCRVSSNRVERRWDHETYRTLDDGDVVQAVPIYTKYDTTQYGLILTGTDLCLIKTGTGETYQYLTPTYTTGEVSGVSSATITGNAAANWATGAPDINAGDKFIIDSDHTAAGEPDSAWATISSVDNDTQLTLTGAYGGAGTSGTYKIRKVYSCPDGERWSYATVAGKFCFTNGNVYAQYWDGSATTAASVNSTYLYQARYCVAYANRLVSADMYDSGLATRNPWLLRCSKLNDPTNYTDSTAADYYFYDMPDPITGLGVVGDQLIVYRKTMYHIGRRTSTSTDPLYFPGYQTGVGLHAPYSLVHYLGTNAWLGVDDFYTMNGSTAVSIGGSIRKKFFSIIDDDDLEKVFGINDYRHNEIIWVANTTEGQYAFTWNYKENQPYGVWSVNTWAGTLTGLGGYGV